MVTGLSLAITPEITKTKQMDQKINEIEINGLKYVLKGTGDSVDMPISDAVLVRSESAGVFYGNIAENNVQDGVVKLTNARRVWYWSGAASLSQLAVDGTSKPKDCKFPTPVPSIQLSKVIEVISMSEKALESLNSVPIWKQ